MKILYFEYNCVYSHIYYVLWFGVVCDSLTLSLLLLSRLYPLLPRETYYTRQIQNANRIKNGLYLHLS